jgi:hypothetical protein
MRCLCVCVYLCVYLCVYAFMRLCGYVYVFMFMCLCVYVFMFIYFYLIFGYRNPGVRTIEDQLEVAIYKAGGISKDNFRALQKVEEI